MRNPDTLLLATGKLMRIARKRVTRQTNPLCHRLRVRTTFRAIPQAMQGQWRREQGV